MNAVEIKERVLRLGADLCGIAPADRLAGAPKGFGPTEIWDECRSVVVFASRFPRSALSAKTPSPYTFVRNRMVEKLDTISFALAEEMERAGAVSIVGALRRLGQREAARQGYPLPETRGSPRGAGCDG